MEYGTTLLEMKSLIPLDQVVFRLDQRVELHLTRSSSAPSGIYRCEMETQAMNDNGSRESVYVGLYHHDTEGA